ncbi:CRISPR-associated endoribonuclease Cas6 [Sesbania bispinosa]|nr:CRISPR-associated endoribonuclease Cas6 [Sesbania bispinosa]
MSYLRRSHNRAQLMCDNDFVAHPVTTKLLRLSHWLQGVTLGGADSGKGGAVVASSGKEGYIRNKKEMELI